MKRDKTVEDFIASVDQWQTEVRTLRKILRSTELKEEIKWGIPCYTLNGKNVVGIGAFKSYFGLWFYQGALLRDKDKTLINAQEGTTKALRQWRMNSAQDIRVSTIRAYVTEAIGLMKDGKNIGPERKKPIAIPPELRKALEGNSTIEKTFNEMLPGKRREYADYVAQAKRDTTKQKRVDKILPMIAANIGLNDKYR